MVAGSSSVPGKEGYHPAAELTLDRPDHGRSFLDGCSWSRDVLLPGGDTTASLQDALYEVGLHHDRHASDAAKGIVVGAHADSVALSP